MRNFIFFWQMSGSYPRENPSFYILWFLIFLHQICLVCLVIEVWADCNLVEKRVNSVHYLTLVLLSHSLVSTLHVKCCVFSCVTYCWHSRNSLCVTCCSYHLNLVDSKMFHKPSWIVVQCAHFWNFVHLTCGTRYIAELILHHNKFCKELRSLFSINVSSFIYKLMTLCCLSWYNVLVKDILTCHQVQF
jgi:hypothetical protein